MADTYRYISTKLRGIRMNAILVDDPLGRNQVWIPRSLIHGADEMKLHARYIGEERMFRIFEWKAEDLGFA
jgi:hypothetical protein